MNNDRIYFWVNYTFKNIFYWFRGEFPGGVCTSVYVANNKGCLGLFVVFPSLLQESFVRLSVGLACICGDVLIK